MKIGFIGLGSLGAPIAMNILENGHSLHVYNRTISKTKSLADRGAIVSESVASLAKECDIIFTIVSDDAALKEISEGVNGLVKNMKPGGIHVSMSTILPKTAADISILHQKQNQHYLAAPVFGRPEAATARKLNFAISGEETIRNKVEPVLKDAGAAGVWHFGDLITAANTVKLCGNFLIAGALEAIGESINLAAASGVNPQDMWNMFLQTLFNAPVYHNYSNIILNKKFKPAAFTAKLGLKDLNLVIEQGQVAKQSMPLAELVKSNMQKLVDSGNETIDWSAVSTDVNKNL
jgi:3-hydroxyisobutyrate dehydrogenase-like beta-hydroxyacid dehydrogenase